MQRFLFHAQAIGLAGKLKGQEFQHGAVILPQHGGRHVDRITWTGDTKVQSGYIKAEVFGTETPDAWVTMASVWIEELNLFDRITAELLTAKVKGSWFKGDDSPVLTLEGLAYEGLKIDGQLQQGWGRPVEIPNLGTLYTAEQLKTDKMLRFTMFRLVLEPGLRSNEDGGEITGGDVVGNGHTYPP